MKMVLFLLNNTSIDFFMTKLYNKLSWKRFFTLFWKEIFHENCRQRKD